jgi:hypothetical protein
LSWQALQDWRDRAEGRLQVVQVVGLGGGHQLLHLALHLVAVVLELGLLGPDVGLRLGVGGDVLGAGRETRPRQLGHFRRDLRVVHRRLGVVGRTAVDHRTDTAEVLRHDEHDALAVLDRVFGLGELRGSRGGHRESGGGEGQRGGELHGFLLRG